VHVEEGASATVFATFHRVGEGKQFTNAVFSGNVAANAELTLEKFEEVGDEGYLICTERIDQARDSRFHIRTLTNSGTLVRNTLHIVVNGEGCETNLYGTYSPRGKEHVDNATVVDHRVPNCVSNELYKGIIWDQATGVFNGKVFVREDAQHTNAFQQNNNILMSEHATMNSKPELEIYADDVQCSHGSTTGQFDEEAVFYLKARGIRDTNARKMLIEAFRGEVIDAIADEGFKAFVVGRLV
jgi:Fe-S cluster assembly protein SufD